MPQSPPSELSAADSAPAADEERQLLTALLMEKYEPIAIVGMGLRFPGGNTSPADLADFLRTGGCGTVPIPDDRWDVAALDADGGDAPGRIRTTSGGFLDQIDVFDPQFFNISPREAQYIDPQQRLVLETAWEALEHANIDPAALRGGNGAVYIGAGCHDYGIEARRLPLEEMDGHLGTGTSHSAISGRLSYFLGWRGPCMTVDTACSSSLVALHLSTEGLRRGETDIALCGGVSIVHHPLNHVVFSQAKMLAADGRCKTFDDSADGYGRSEGCGVIVLKRLSDARRDGDRIVALIRGVAVRQDGESGGLTVPNGPAQEIVMRAAIAAAHLEAADIQYVEAHGTGTPLGDPIEIGAIGNVFAASHDTNDPVIVASFKTNVGHMEAAAGIGGIIKTALQLSEPDVFPHLNLVTPSHHIAWDTLPVTVPTRAQPWPAGVRRALVNSFGFAGTIASAVLEQAPVRRAAAPGPTTDETAEARPHVFTLSAKTPAALALQIARVQAHLSTHPHDSVADLSYTASIGRSALAVRLAGVVRTRAELDDLLHRAATGAGPKTDAITALAFLFPGQGAQYPQMGAELYRSHPVFRAHVDACDRLFQPYLGRSVTAMICDPGQDVAELAQTRFTQPVLFTIEYALAMLWLSWGARPSVLLGHSIGEVAAATVAGLFALPDAVRLVAARSRLMQSVRAPGGMASVSAPADDVATLISRFPDLAVAAHNAPGITVLSGGEEHLTDVLAELTAGGVPVRRLTASHAFHSALMDEVAEEFRAAIAGITFHEPEFTLISNVTGEVAEFADIASVDYWVRHIGAPVKFRHGMEAVARRGRHAFLEIGPGATLIGLGKRCVAPTAHTWLTSTHPRDLSDATILGSLATLYRGGLAVSWTAVHSGHPGRRIDLPTYAFDRRRYWLPGGAGARLTSTAASTIRGDAGHPLLGTEIPTTEPGVREFAVRLNASSPAYLADHVVAGQVVFPAAGFVEMLLAAQDAVFGASDRLITDLQILEPLLLRSDEDADIRVRITGGDDDDVARVVILGRITASATTLERSYVTATFGGAAEDGGGLAGLDEPLGALQYAITDPGRPVAAHEADDIYPEFADLGLTYGERFQLLRHIDVYADDVAVGHLVPPPASPLDHVSPALLDCALQTAFGVMEPGQTYLPVRIERFRLWKKPRGHRLRSAVQVATGEPGSPEMVLDIALFDGDRPVFLVQGLTMRRMENPRGGSRRHLFHEPFWTKRSLPPRQGAGSARVVLMVGASTEAAREFRGTPEPAADATPLTVVACADVAEVGALLPGGVTDLCWFWQTDPSPAGAGRLRGECERNYRELLDLTTVLERSGAGGAVRLWLVTHGSQAMPGDPVGDGGALAAATLWGFGHTMWSEYPGLRITMVDLPPDRSGYDDLRTELTAGDSAEFQISYRAGHRHVRRIRPAGPGATHGDRQLVIGRYGEFAGIKTVPVVGVPPQGDEIQVRVRAAGLNFKDVLNALGMLDEHARQAGRPTVELPLGLECAGTVVAVGPDAAFAIGDDVMVCHIGCMKELLTVSSRAAVRKPAAIDFAEAAGIPTAYTSAYYALYELAGIKAGDRVLIHAAAGGVGQAAVQLARLAGAEVFATASPRKWGLLRAQGVAHVMNSRTLDFADEILAATGGHGVDIVLNSLNKEYIAAGMRALAPGGHFVELGKIGALTYEEAASRHPEVTYHNFDLGELPPEEAVPLIHRILTETVDLMDRGDLAALPTTTYALDEAAEAFGVLSRGANVGKIAICFDPDPLPARPLVLDADETYLVTGGLGALGLAAAEKLTALGARRLALVGRRAPSADEVAELEQRFGPDVRVTVHTGDIADAGDLARIMTAIRTSGYPLAGVLHAAGVLADGSLATADWARFDISFAPKVYGTWLLHEAVRDLPGLKFFVGFSSVASILGPNAQANYAAANAFLDAMMHWRRALTLPGLSVNWGPWGQIGMAAKLSPAHARSVEEQGQTFLRPADGLRALAQMLGTSTPQILIGEVDWDRHAASRPLPNALFQGLAREGRAPAEQIDVAAILALPRADRHGRIVAAIRAIIARVLHFDGPDDVPTDARFGELGLDSLVAVELKNALEQGFGCGLTTSVVFDHPTVTALADMLHQRISPEDPTASTTAELVVTGSPR